VPKTSAHVFVDLRKAYDWPLVKNFGSFTEYGVDGRLLLVDKVLYSCSEFNYEQSELNHNRLHTIGFQLHATKWEWKSAIKRPLHYVSPAWASEGFFPGVPIKIFPGGGKVVKFNFTHAKVRNNFFVIKKENVKFQNPGEVQGPTHPLPTSMLSRNPR